MATWVSLSSGAFIFPCLADRIVGKSAKPFLLGQGITLLWTLLQSGHESLGGNPIAKRIIICCPTSLVNNWDSECSKWLKVQAHVHAFVRTGCHLVSLF